MAKLYLEPRFLKIQHIPLSRCPHPQYNEQCMGLYLKTRAWQTECVGCMRLHGTIDKHPLLFKLKPVVEDLYKYHGVMAEDIIEVQQEALENILIY